MEDIQRVPIAKLRASPLNVRRSGKGTDIAQLADDISTRGLLQNLIGTWEVDQETGERVVHVHGGGRRMSALQYVQENGLCISVDGKDIAPGDYLVPVRVFLNADNAVEASLMENIQRADMSPVDQYRAWAKIIHKEGLSIKELASRTGFDVKFVTQRMKLGQLHDAVLDALEAGTIRNEAAMCFTLAGSRDEQAAVLAKLQAETPPGMPIATHRIRDLLTATKVSARSSLGAFVDQEYRAAGHPITSDLFCTEDLFDDKGIVEMIAETKLKAKCQELEREGWAWTEQHLKRSEHKAWRCQHEQPDLGLTLSPEDEAEKLVLTVEMEDILARYPAPVAGDTWGDDGPDFMEWQDADLDRYNDLEQMVLAIDTRARPAYSAEAKAVLGCFVSIDHDGGFLVQCGYRSDEPPRTHGDSVPAIVHPATVIPAHAADLPKDGLKDVLKRDLGAQRTVAFEAALADNPDHAQTLLLYTLWGQVQGVGFIVTPTSIKAAKHWPECAIGDPRTGSAGQYLDASGAMYKAMFKGKTGTVMYDAIHSLSAGERAKLQAYLVARTVDAPMAKKSHLAEHIGSLMGVSIRKSWTPGEDLFSRAPLGWLEANLPVSLRDGARRLGREKKDVRVSALCCWFSDPASIRPAELAREDPLTDVEIAEINDWVPPGMEFLGVSSRT